MERLKKIALGLLRPPSWLATLVVFPSFALVIYVLAAGETESLLAYAAYGASAYALVLVCVRVPDVIRAFRTGFSAHPRILGVMESEIGKKYRENPEWRVEISLYAGLAVNLAFAAVKLISGLLLDSLWFGSLAAYYLLLAFLRYALAHYVLRHRHEKNLSAEWRRYRLCGAALLLMNQAVSAVTFWMVRQNQGFEYPGILIYVMAMYAFFAVANAVKNLIRARRHESPVLSAVRVCSLVAAMMSMLALETAMLSQFGGAEDALFRRRMIGATGGAVCIIVLVISVYMMIRSTRQILRLERQGESKP